MNEIHESGNPGADADEPPDDLMRPWSLDDLRLELPVLDTYSSIDDELGRSRNS